METFYAVQLKNLSRGIRDSQDVYILQILLNSFGYSCGTPDGIYGSRTASGVLAFRRAVGLPAASTVDMATWDKIFNYRK